MTKAGLPGRDPTPIGTIAAPKFALPPDPLALFQRRAVRLRSLAVGHQLASYLRFLADLADAQAAVQGDLPEPAPLDPAQLERAKAFGLSPLDRNRFSTDAVFEATLDRLLLLAGGIAMPEAAAAALERLIAADTGARQAMVQAVLRHAVPVEMLAEHSYVAAALQVHFARLAARLDARTLQPVGDGLCPVCGGPPVASMVVGWQGADGTRYCGCGLCGTLWHYVRIKCALCGSTKGISYQEVEGGPGTVKAETCTNCHGYLKILQQQKDPAVELVADDVASLGLDLLVRETGFRRGGVNPFLLGY